MTKRIQRSSRPALWILLFLGLKPDVLIEMGYSKGTVYKYSAQLPKIKQELNNQFHICKQNKKKERK